MPGLKVHWIDLAPRDITKIEGLRVTEMSRTLFDVASEVSHEVLEEALDDALRRGLVSLARMKLRLAEHEGKRLPGVKRMRALIEGRAGQGSIPESVFETRLLRLLSEAGLPRPVIQHEIKDSGRLVARVDFAFPQSMVAVEADGYRWHGGRRGWERDLARRTRLASLGWRVLHVTWTDLTNRPEQTLDLVRGALD
jgi:hypothetical protein